jgi:lipopolysaccharide assembly outer membrane protein LptD (OstA)
VLHKQQRSYLLIYIVLFINSAFVYGQDLPTKNEVNIPSATEKEADTTTVNLKPIASERLEILNDTIKNDSIKEKSEFLTGIVDYYGEDYIFMDQINHKIYMYDKAYIVYEDMRIDAGLIILDYNTNEVFAKGIDSAGAYTQRPLFVQAQNRVEPDSMKFNTKTQKAIVYNSRTEQNGFNVLAQVTKKENDSVIYLKNVRFTTSTNLEDPEYYFYTRKAKFVPKEKIVTGLTNMYIANVPTPIGLPFAYFPLSEDRASGFIIPAIGDNNNRGFFFQNGGYYFAINDYVDLAILGDYYTNGSYGLRGETAYALRYKFRGNFNVRYESLIDSERGFPDFSQSTVYNIRWNHSQDTKANPTSRFSASVNLGSSSFFRQSINQTNNGSGLVNTLSSSVSYAKTFDGEPQLNFTAAGTHTQNTNTQEINMSLPNVNASVSRVFPFAPKNGVKKGIIKNINFQYDVTAENRFQTTDSLFFKPEMFESAQLGARHSIPVSTNFKVLNYLSSSISTSLQETWVGSTTGRTFDASANNGQGAVVIDTLNGFDRYFTYNFSTSLGTTVYGTFNFGENTKIQKLRHVMRPNVSYNINPAFDQYYEELQVPTADPNVASEVIEFSRFQNTLFGAPNQTYSSNIGMSLSNTFEAKVRDKDTTAIEAKKIVLLNNFNFSTAYNLAGDSLPWSPVRFTGSIPIVNKLDINLTGSLDPYALDNNNQKIDQFNIDNGGSLFRLTNGNISLNYSFSSEDFEGDNPDDTDRIDDETFANGGRPDDLFGVGQDIGDGTFNRNSDKENGNSIDKDWYKFDIPWDLRLAYTITYNNNQRQNEISSQSLMYSTNVELAPRWKVGVSSGYDFTNKGVTLTQLRFERDLESWRISFNWTPIGARNTAWYFFIGIKSSILSDIKYDKRREPDRNL